MATNSYSHIFQRDLLSEERILWTGQPIPTRLLNISDVFVIPFSLLWSSAIFPMFKGIWGSTQSFDFPFSFFPLIFLGVGFYMTIGRFIHLYLYKKNTYYAVTNKRVLVYNNLFNKSFQSAFIKELPAINKSANSQSIGSINFGDNRAINNGFIFFGQSKITTPTFMDIHNVNYVYDLILKQKN